MSQSEMDCFCLDRQQSTLFTPSILNSSLPLESLLTEQQSNIQSKSRTASFLTLFNFIYLHLHLAWLVSIPSILCTSHTSMSLQYLQSSHFTCSVHMFSGDLATASSLAPTQKLRVHHALTAASHQQNSTSKAQQFLLQTMLLCRTTGKGAQDTGSSQNPPGQLHWLCDHRQRV